MGIDAKSVASMALLLLSGIVVGQETRMRPLPDLDKNLKTGPAVGSRIPAFEAADQNGRKRTFETLRGPKGLVLLFVRSADW
jgi:hypothetical protein